MVARTMQKSTTNGVTAAGNRTSKYYVYCCGVRRMTLLSLLISMLLILFQYQSLIIFSENDTTTTMTNPEMMLSMQKQGYSPSFTSNNNVARRVPNNATVTAPANDGSFQSMTVSSSTKTPTTTTTSTSSKRHLLLHIGPPKTGSTTLQCYMRDQEFQALAEDNYLLMETESCRREFDEQKQKKPVNPLYGNGFIPKCLQELEEYVDNTNATTERPSCWQEYIQAMQQHFKKHVVISNENMSIGGPYRGPSSMTWNTILLPDLLHYFDSITIVAVYRHYFDWIASFYNQEFKNRWSKPKKFGAWPGTTRRAIEIPRIIDYTMKALQSRQRRELDQWMSILKPYESNPRVNFIVLNMHRADSVGKQYTATPESESESKSTTTKINLETDFFCRTIPNMPHMCDYVSHPSSTDVALKNPSMNGVIWYDRMATQAYRMGWIQTKQVSRDFASKAARAYHRNVTLRNKTKNENPLSCPNTIQLEMLWNRSLTYAQTIFEAVPSFAQPSNLEQHLRQGWDRSVNIKHSLCDVNVTQMLLEEGPNWENFYRSLRPQLDMTVYGKAGMDDNHDD